MDDSFRSWLLNELNKLTLDNDQLEMLGCDPVEGIVYNLLNCNEDEHPLEEWLWAWLPGIDETLYFSFCHQLRTVYYQLQNSSYNLENSTKLNVDNRKTSNSFDNIQISQLSYLEDNNTSTIEIIPDEIACYTQIEDLIGADIQTPSVYDFDNGEYTFKPDSNNDDSSINEYSHDVEVEVDADYTAYETDINEADDDEDLNWFTIHEIELDELIEQHRNCDVEAALECILTAETQAENCKPCRYAMNSIIMGGGGDGGMETGMDGYGCTRPGCSYSHDFKSVACKYWLTKDSGCTANPCVYLHGYSSNPIINKRRSMTNERRATSYRDSQSSPSIPNINMTNMNGHNNIEIYHSNLATNTMFNDVTDINYENTNAIMVKKNPYANRNDMGYKSKLDGNDVGYKKKSQIQVLPKEWTRAEAKVLVSQRNRYFEQATIAYRSGSKVDARNLSRKGHETAIAMRIKHKQAAMQIFSQRNSVDAVCRGVIDLHGLFVLEARECLLEILPSLLESPLTHVNIVTGSGHHSAGSHRRARLLPGVKQLLREEGYRFSDICDANGYTGAVRVDL
eukprot:gene4384-8727_t